MSTEENSNTRNSTLSYLALRRWLGILGLTLPVLIWVVNDFQLKPSISHFYYSHSSVIFTGFLCAFGIFLISYPGRIDETDRISDNWVTTIGGAGAILTALIPTAFYSECDKPLDYNLTLSNFCDGGELTTQFLHNHGVLGTVHLISAAVFLILMGYMSFARFTKGNTTPRMKVFYRICGVMVWIPLAVLGIEFATGKHFSAYDVYICECISLGFFGMAWLVKGKAFRKFGIT